MIDIRPAALAVLTVAALSGCGLTELITYGCSDRDREFAGTLAGLPVLAAHPDGATEVGAGSGCDDDDGFAHAGRNYRSDLDRAAIQDFYRAAAEKDGWAAGGERTDAATSCFTREIDGTTAYLSIWYPSDFNDTPGLGDAPEDEYGLNVTASHDGDAWC
ncbi:hypothetical protein AB0F81_24960 [Actinoplanes sp. NPDC024001]|uniref:hypothetical protein n=1 Tax=Actinoplanes sp. NPDC024001 TaxID=3154598 RepID=UPI0033E332BF